MTLSAAMLWACAVRASSQFPRQIQDGGDSKSNETRSRKLSRNTKKYIERLFVLLFSIKFCFNYCTLVYCILENSKFNRNLYCYLYYTTSEICFYKK